MGDRVGTEDAKRCDSERSITYRSDRATPMTRAMWRMPRSDRVTAVRRVTDLA